MSNYVLTSLIKSFEQVLADDNRETQDARLKKGEYFYVPYSLDRFQDELRSARVAYSILGNKSLDALKFIDAGCGVGTKVLAAQSMHFDAYGVEKDPRYVKVAKKLLATYGVTERIFEGDAIKFDYSPYNIVYFYRPLCDPKLEEKLEKRILSTVKKGTVIIAVGGTHPDFEKLCRHVGGTSNVFVRI